MKKQKLIAFLCLIVCVIVSLVYLFKDTKLQDTPVRKISIVIRGKTNESWENLKQGAEQAASDLNALVSFVTLSSDKDAKEQKEILLREMESGADAIIWSPVFHNEDDEFLKKGKKSVATAYIESTVINNKDNLYVLCDNKKMGQDLGQEVIRHGNTRKKIAVLDGGLTCSSVILRKSSFKQSIEETKNEYLEWNNIDMSKDIIVEKMLNESVDVIVALDNSVLEVAAKAAEKYYEIRRKKVEVYGVGSSKSVISDLENGWIVSTVVQDDFSMGYLAVKNVINKLDGKKVESNNNIVYTIIDNEHMYSKKNQRLLFPFVR